MSNFDRGFPSLSLVYLPSGGNLPTLHSHHGNLLSETPVFHGVTVTIYSFPLGNRLDLKAELRNIYASGILVNQTRQY